MGSLSSKKVDQISHGRNVTFKWVTLSELYSIHATLPVTGSVKKVCFKCHSFSVMEPPWLTRWLMVSDWTRLRSGLPPSVTLTILLDLKLVPGWASPVRSSRDVGPVTPSHCRAPLVLNSARHCTAWPLEQRSESTFNSVCLHPIKSRRLREYSVLKENNNKPQPNVVLQNI